ncbi:ATP synthase subunit alpha domain protein [Mycobacterium xenopi 3993]|nr:ATP synthase subunit alpha domain protein [Mycobacterium xenopi 3993]
MAELTISPDDIQGAIEEYVSSFTSETAREEVGTVIDAGTASRMSRVCPR